MNLLPSKFKGFKLIVFFTLALTTNASSVEKIGFVDMERLINESPQIKNAGKTINADFEDQYEEIERKEKDLEVLENSINKDGPIMTLDMLKPLQERARILDRQIRREKEDLKDSMSIRSTQILSKIQENLGETVKSYAKKNGYDAIIINSILYVSDEMDITEEILQVLKDKNK